MLCGIMSVMKNYQKDKNILTNKIPASKWEDAAPIGNGRIGAMVYGGIFDERILLNNENLYFGEKTIPLPNINNQLKELREILDEGFC